MSDLLSAAVVGSAVVQVRADTSQTGDDIKRGVGSGLAALGNVLSSSGLGAGLAPVLNAVEGIQHGLDTATQKGSLFGRTLTGIGTGLAALGGIGIHFAEPLEKADAELEQIFSNLGKNISDYKGQLDSAVATGEKFGHTQADTTEALAKLTAATKDPDEALKEMSVTEDIAAAKHISLAQAAQLVAQIHAGSSRVLKQFGIDASALGLSSESAAAAEQKQAAAADKLSTAQQRLSDFEQSSAEKRAEAEQAYASRVQSAQDRVSSSEQSLADLQARLGEEIAQKKEEYAQREADAAQKIIDAESALAVAEGQAASDRADAAQSVQEAQENLADLQQRQNAQNSGDPQAAQRVSQEQELRHAEEAVQKAEQREAQVSQQSDEKVAKAAQQLAQAKADKATLDAQAATIGKLNASEQAELANAQRSIAAAQADLQKVVAAGPQSKEQQLSDLQEEKRLQDDLNKAKADYADASDKATAAKDNDAKVSKVLEEIESRIGGVAEKQSQTTAGHLASLKAKVEDFAAHAGESVGKFAATAGPAIAGVGLLIESGIVAKMGSAIGSLIQGGAAMLGFGTESAAAGAEGAAGGIAFDIAWAPIILLIAAIAAGAYLIINNWGAISKFFSDVGSAIFSALKSVWDWVQNNWPLLLAILGGPFGLAVKFIVDNWNGILGFFEGLPKWFADTFTSVGKAIANAFIWGVNQVIGAWNWLMSQLKIPGFDVGPVHFGGLDIGGGLKISPIQYLAQGGLIKATPGGRVVGVAEGGQDEIVSPLPAIQKAVADALRESGGGGDRPIVVQLVLDGKVITEVVTKNQRTMAMAQR